jgi:hypothetical protein
VKNSFFRARRFRDHDDVAMQLVEWLQQVNVERPSDATGVIPAVALEAERRWLAERPVRVIASDHPLRFTAVVTPMGTVPFAGTSYFASATRLGAPATILVRRDTIEILIGNPHAPHERCVHHRDDHTGKVSRLPSQRQDMLSVIHGKRKIATFRRQCLLEVGKPAWSFLSVLVHRCPNGRWEEPCTTLYELLVRYGDDAMREAFERCVREERFSVDAVFAALQEVA